MEYNQELLDSIVKELKVEVITAKCLINCGLSSIEECREFLNPSLDKLTPISAYSGLMDVAKRVQEAIDNKERVLIYGDYDADGICSTAMLKIFLEERGVEVNYYIPDRREDGYGMNEETIDEITEEFDPDLFITVDCGITNVSEVDYIYNDLGRDIVITDHHEPQETLPNCKIFNPHLTKDGAYENLCGAGVVLRLIEALSSFEESKKYLDLAAIATVADMVPLNEDNRAIVKYGLEMLNNKPRAGLDALIKTFSRDKLTSTDIGFKLAPRINAVGRISNANALVEIFKETDPFLIQSLVEDIDEFHNQRQALTKKLYDSVEEALVSYDFNQYPIIVLYSKGWDEGVLGITAARVAKSYNRPTILLTDALDGSIKGSGRSIPQINIFECVSNSSSKLAKFGGHSQACGLSLAKEDIDAFRKELNDYFKANFSNDILLEKDEVAFDFHEIKNLTKVASELELLEPYGQGNKKPLFASTVKNLHFKPMKEGLEHIIYKSGNFQMVGFFLLDKLDVLNSAVEKKITFTLSLNTFRNYDYVQALIQDISCISFSDFVIASYVITSLYPDKSIFYPKAITMDESIDFMKNEDYATAYLCYSKSTFDEFLAKCPKKIVKNAYFVESPCPNNAIYFNIQESADFTKYKRVVFLDRPISLGFIDILKLNKDCEVFYVENGNGLKLLRNNIVPYDMLGRIYLEIAKILDFNPNTRAYDLFIDIENLLNVNYNNFIVAICIFMDLGLMTKEGKYLVIQKGVKNPIKNSRLYNLIMEG